MLFDLVDILQKKRRLLIVAVCIVFDFWLLLVCNQVLQSHRTDITTRIRNNTETAQSVPEYQNDLFGNGDVLVRVDRTLNSAETGALRALLATTDGITKVDHGLQTASKATFHAVGVAASATIRGIATAITATIHGIGASLLFMGRVIAFPFVAVGHGVGHVARAATGMSLASVIQPNRTAGNAPVITREQAEQVSLIQEGTLAVAPIRPNGVGGACDNGAGNGGYPMEWCDARMDTIKTVSYSNDRINRQCTSYAYWYFTTILGHHDFHVTGNANRWARTSNYPVHAEPAVGAIAVQTSGYYGHVAIVQALPGETHDGKVVPDGYVLVSEMNYDWQGHFRYSYSSLSKFSAYIYP